MIAGMALAGVLMLSHELMEEFRIPYHNLLLLLFLPVFAAGMALLAKRETVIHRRSEELEQARRRLDDLMLDAIAQRGSQVAFEEAGLATCWRELACDKEDCPAYGREQARCWLIAGTFCRGEVQGQFARKLKDCRLCEVYKKATTDPVSEITEHFYALNYLLSEREEQLEEAYENARIRGEKLAGLVGLSEAAISSVHLNDLLTNLLESAAALVGADFGYVSLVDSEEAMLVARVTYGFDAGFLAELNAGVGEGIVGQAYASGEVVVSEDVPADTRVTNPFLQASQAQTLISLPLVGRERPLGMLTLGTITSHRYTSDEKDSLNVAADHIAVTIENAMLESRLGSGRDQVELLMAANRDLGTGGGVENVYKSFIANARRLVDFDRASLMVLNRDASELEIVAADTAAPRTWLGKGIRLPLEALPADRIYNDNRPLIRSRISTGEYSADKLLLEEGIKSEIVLPLASEGEVLGSFNLGSFSPEAFDIEDVDLLLPLTRQLGLIIDNARLLQDVKRFDLVDRLTRLYNHRFFFEALSREIARSARDGKAVAVMLVDIVGFKEFNAQRSRAEGDRILMGVADVLKASVREIDIAARYAGDKFSVLLPDVSTGDGKDGVMGIATRIQDEIEERVFVDGAGELLTPCIGISEYPKHAGDPMKLLERADKAVQAAREAGERCVMAAPDEPDGEGTAAVEDDPAGDG